MTLSVQFLTMVSMIVGGLYLGMVLDTFRRFQRHWKRNVVLVYVMEVFFWLTQIFILYYILFRINAGELRFYVFAACLLGFSAYQVFVKSLYKRLLEKLINIVARIYQLLYRLVKMLIFTPIKYIAQLLVAFIIFLFNTILLVLGFVLKCVYLPLKWILIRIYRLLPKKLKVILHHLAGFYSKIQNICIKYWRYISSKRR